MKVLYFFLALVILYALFIFLRLIVTIRRADLVEFRHEEMRIGSGPELRYIAAGDSTAQGVGASSVGTTYTRQLAEHLAKSHLVLYKNISAKGARTDDFIKIQLPEIIAYKPDIITISIGANDAIRFRLNKKILANLVFILNELQEKAGAEIFIAEVPNFKNARLLPRWYTAIVERKDKPLNEEIRKLGNGRVKIVPVHEFGWDRFPDIFTTFAADKFHPNDIGYENWRDAFISKMRESGL